MSTELSRGQKTSIGSSEESGDFVEELGPRLFRGVVIGSWLVGGGWTLIVVRSFVVRLRRSFVVRLGRWVVVNWRLLVVRVRSRFVALVKVARRVSVVRMVRWRLEAVVVVVVLVVVVVVVVVVVMVAVAVAVTMMMVRTWWGMDYLSVRMGHHRRSLLSVVVVVGRHCVVDLSGWLVVWR